MFLFILKARPLVLELKKQVNNLTHAINRLPFILIAEFLVAILLLLKIKEKI